MEKVHTIEENYRETTASSENYLCCYLPHHSVIKESSTTTKLRVVFGASRATSNGTSLNNKMMKGPVIQNDLATHLLRWCKYKVAFTADLEKMYRQIKVSSRHSEFQRIVWRKSINSNIEDYKLKTVTFGTRSAPYFATRVLKHFALDEQTQYPIASEKTLDSFYVDDLISGADTIEAALVIQRQLIALMKAGAFSLRKWSSNNEKILEAVPESDREITIPLQIKEDESIRTLGHHWNPSTDKFSYTINIIQESDQKWTKRTILSEISKVFDPLGLLSPFIILANIFIQHLWLLGLNWDDEVNPKRKTEWLKYRNSMKEIENIQISRWSSYTKNAQSIELHGFSDASIRAYAASIYLCITDENGVRRATLLISKTKVSPIKTISLPRLELCGAALLAKLFNYVVESLKLPIEPIKKAWTDSEIVLAWLKGHPSKRTTFVANRVSDIHQKLGQNIWAHVSSAENPADCASRGLYPNDFIHHKLWWHGSEWLLKSPNNWLKVKEVKDIETKLRKIKTFHQTASSQNSVQNFDFDFLENRYSSLTKHGQAPPACVQNAMMTKDKKPFTYTPSGIDLSQIKSPRMAKRIARNAQMEGVSSQPKPSTLAASQNNHTSAHPTSPTMAAQAVGMPVQVFPTGPPPPPPLKSPNSVPPLPPPQPGQNILAPESNRARARISQSPMQKFEPPPIGFRPEIKIPPNPMASLRKVAKPKEKNDFWIEEYRREKSGSPNGNRAAVTSAEYHAQQNNDRSLSPAPIQQQPKNYFCQGSSPLKYMQQQQESSQPATTNCTMKSYQLSQRQMQDGSTSPLKGAEVNQFSLHEQPQNHVQNPLRSPRMQQCDLNRDQDQMKSSTILQKQNQCQETRSQNLQGNQIASKTPEHNESSFRAGKDISNVYRPLSPIQIVNNKQSDNKQESSIKLQKHNSQYPYEKLNTQTSEYPSVKSPTLKDQQEEQSLTKNSQVVLDYIPPVSTENISVYQNQQSSNNQGNVRKGPPPNRWVTPTKDVPDWARKNDTTLQHTLSHQEQHQQEHAPPQIHKRQQPQSQHQFKIDLKQQNPMLKLETNNLPIQSGILPRERIIPIQIEKTPTTTPPTPDFPGSNSLSSTPGTAALSHSPGYIVRIPNQFVDQGYEHYPGQQQQITAGNRIIPISIEGSGGSSPFNSNCVRGPVSQQPIVIQNDPRTFQHQNSWSGNTTNGPSQSKSFRILQKITSTEDSDNILNRDSPTMKNYTNMDHPPPLQRANFSPPMIVNGQQNQLTTLPQQTLQIDNEQLKRMHINEQDHLNFINRVRSQGTPPFMRQSQPPRYAQQPGGYCNDDLLQQQYEHPSEQKVVDPKIYTYSAIPSRSFKLLQQMTTPENAAEMESSDVDYEHISSNSSYSSTQNQNNDNTDIENNNKNDNYSNNSIKNNNSSNNKNKNNNINRTQFSSDHQNYPFPPFPAYPPYAYSPYPPPYQFPSQNLQNINVDMKSWPYPPPPYPYYYPQYYPPVAQPHAHHIPLEYDPNVIYNSYGNLYSSYDSNNVIPRHLNFVRNRNSMKNTITNKWRNSAPPNIIVTQSFDETEEEEQFKLDENTSGRRDIRASSVIDSNCEKPDIFIRSSSMDPDTEFINTKQIISKFNSIIKSDTHQNSISYKKMNKSKNLYNDIMKKTMPDSFAIDESSSKVEEIKNSEVINFNISQINEKPYLGEANKQVSKIQSTSQTSFPKLNSCSSNSPLSNFTQSDNQNASILNTPKIYEQPSEETSFSDSDISESESSFEKYEELQLCFNKPVGNVLASNTEINETSKTGIIKNLQQRNLRNKTESGEDLFLDKAFVNDYEDIKIDHEMIFNQIQILNTKSEIPYAMVKDTLGEIGEEVNGSNRSTVEALDNEDNIFQNLNSDDKIFVEEDVNLVSVRLPLKLSFSRSENDESVTTVEIGTSEIKDTLSRRSSVASIIDDPANLNYESRRSSMNLSKEYFQKSEFKKSSLSDIKDQLKQISNTFVLDDTHILTNMSELHDEVSLKENFKDTQSQNILKENLSNELALKNDNSRRFSITSISAVDSDDCDVSVTVNLSTNDYIQRQKLVDSPIFKKEGSVITDDEDVSVSFSLNMRNKFLAETYKEDINNNIAKSNSQASSNDCTDLMTEIHDHETIIESDHIPTQDFGTTSEAVQTTWEEHSKVTSMLIAKWAYNNRDLDTYDSEHDKEIDIKEDTEDIDFWGCIKKSNTTNTEKTVDLATNIEETLTNEADGTEIDFWATINNHDDDGYHRTPIIHKEINDDYFSTKSVSHNGELLSVTRVIDTEALNSIKERSNFGMPKVEELSADLWTTNEKISKLKNVQITDKENNIDFFSTTVNEDECNAVQITKNENNTDLICKREYSGEKKMFGNSTKSRGISNFWQTSEKNIEIESKLAKLSDTKVIEHILAKTEDILKDETKLFNDKNQSEYDIWEDQKNLKTKEIENTNLNIENEKNELKMDKEIESWGIKNYSKTNHVHEENEAKSETIRQINENFDSLKSLDDTDICEYIKEAVISAKISDDVTVEKKIEQSFSEKLGKDNIEQQRSSIELREKKSKTKKKRKEQNAYRGQKDIRKEDELVFKEEKHLLGIIANNLNKDNKKKNLNESETDFSLQNIKEKKSKMQKNEVDKLRPGSIEKYVKINKRKFPIIEKETRLCTHEQDCSTTKSDLEKSEQEIIRNDLNKFLANKNGGHCSDILKTKDRKLKIIKNRNESEIELSNNTLIIRNDTSNENMKSENNLQIYKANNESVKNISQTFEPFVQDEVALTNEQDKPDVRMVEKTNKSFIKKSLKEKREKVLKTFIKDKENEKSASNLIQSSIFGSENQVSLTTKLSEYYCTPEKVEYIGGNISNCKKNNVSVSDENIIENNEIDFKKNKVFFEQITTYIPKRLKEKEFDKRIIKNDDNNINLIQNGIEFWDSYIEKNKSSHNCYNSDKNRDLKVEAFISTLNTNDYMQFDELGTLNNEDLKIFGKNTNNLEEFNNNDPISKYEQSNCNQQKDQEEQKEECRNNYRKAVDFFKRQNSFDETEKKCVTDVNIDLNDEHLENSNLGKEAIVARTDSSLTTYDLEPLIIDFRTTKYESEKSTRASSSTTFDEINSVNRLVNESFAKEFNDVSYIEISNAFDRQNNFDDKNKQNGDVPERKIVSEIREKCLSKENPCIESYPGCYNEHHNDEDCEEIEIEIIEENFYYNQSNNATCSTNIFVNQKSERISEARDINLTIKKMELNDKKNDISKTLSVRDKIKSFETGRVEEVKEVKKLDIQDFLNGSKDDSKDNLSRTSSLQRSESEFDDDSGVTDMSKLISETDTESECFPELRKMSRYERAATHSRLFKLLTDENTALSESNCVDQSVEEKKLIEEFNFKPSRKKIIRNVSITRRNNPEVIKKAETMTQRRERLSLPLKMSSSIDSDNLSTSNSPMSPATSTTGSNKAVSDQLVNELIQSLMLKTNVSQFKNLPMEKIQAAAKRVLAEHLDSLENTSLESTPALTPQEFKTDSYSEYYDSWNSSNNHATQFINNSSSSVGSNSKVLIKSSGDASLHDRLPTGFRRGRSIARCPRVISSKTANSDLTRISESPDIFRGASMNHSSIERDNDNAFKYIRSNSTIRWGKV